MAERVVSSGPPRGRRKGSPDTRSAILAAARTSFARHGFAGTTIRGVASAAGVDAALVHHYFGTKDDLFLAALELPVDPRVLIAPAVAGPVDQAAERFLGVFLSVWDDPNIRPSLVAVARGMMDPSANRLLSEGVLPVVIEPIGVALGIDDPHLRMPLVASPGDRPDPDELRARRRAPRLHAPRPGHRDVRAHHPALPDGRPAVAGAGVPPPEGQPTRCGVADSTWRATGVPATVSVSGIGTHCWPSTRYRPW